MTFYRFAHIFFVALAPLLLWISYQFSLWMWTNWIVVSSIQHWMKEYLLTSIPDMAKCPVCESNVLSHSKVKCCSVCKMEYHFNCISLNREERGRLNQETNWYCPQCIEQIFPFNHIVEESEFLPAISPTKHDFYAFDYSNVDIYLPFDLSEGNSNLPIYERDPDINFYTGIHSSVGNNCK